MKLITISFAPYAVIEAVIRERFRKINEAEFHCHAAFVVVEGGMGLILQTLHYYYYYYYYYKYCCEE